MRRIVQAAMLGLLGLTVAEPARAEMWCIRDFGAAQRTCVFPSAHDCVRGALIGGGQCEREGVAEDRREPKRRSERQRGSAAEYQKR